MPVTDRQWRAGETKGWTSALVPGPDGARKKKRESKNCGRMHRDVDSQAKLSAQAGLGVIRSAPKRSSMLTVR